jgi:hypothetical protein
LKTLVFSPNDSTFSDDTRRLGIDYSTAFTKATIIIQNVIKLSLLLSYKAFSSILLWATDMRRRFHFVGKFPPPYFQQCRDGGTFLLTIFRCCAILPFAEYLTLV